MFMVGFDLCNSSSVMRLALLFSYVIKIVTIFIPLLLLFKCFQYCFNHLLSGEPLSKSFSDISKKFFVALIIFFIPGIFSFIFNMIGIYSDNIERLNSCFADLSLDYIDKLEQREHEELKKREEESSNGLSSNSQNNIINNNNNNNNTNNNSNNNSNNNNNSSNISPSNSNNTSLKTASANIIIGDSRTVGMCATFTGDWTNCQFSNGGAFYNGNDVYIAQGSQGFSWFNSTAISAVNNIISSNPDTTFNIYSLMGVNFLLSDIDKYIPKYIELARGSWSNHNLILVSVNPVDEVIEANYGYSTKNSNIISFNNKLHNGTANVANIKYCDTYNSVLSSLSTSDGLHYNASSYKVVYNSMMLCGG